MTRKASAILSLIVAAICCAPAFAQPKLPFYDWGVGPCEYCLYGEWTAKRQTPLFHRMDSWSGVAFNARKNEKLTAVTGVVITLRAGFGKALKSTILQKYSKVTETYSDVKINRDDTFHVLTYHGEGVYTVWYKGQLLEASMDLRELQFISKPKFVWWVKIRNQAGQLGWTRVVQNFTGPKEV